MAVADPKKAIEPSLRRLEEDPNASVYDKILPPMQNTGVYDPRSFRRHRSNPPIKSMSSRDPIPAIPDAAEQSRAPDSPFEARSSSLGNHRQSHEQSTSNGLRSIPKIEPAATSRSPSPISEVSSPETTETDLTSTELPPLQNKSALDQHDMMEPLSGDQAGSFDLVAPPSDTRSTYSLEERSELLFSRAHLSKIFSSPSSLLQFTAFLSTHKPDSVPMLIYYLDVQKAIKAIKYANAVTTSLKPINGHSFTRTTCPNSQNVDLEERAAQAFQALADHDLPAYITQLYIQIVSLSISRRITGALAPHLREASEGLAEVFCLTDPSRPDNPIVFASEEFNRTTQYGLSYVLGRNCRFLQGPKTNRLSVFRLKEAVQQGRDHCEVFLNYRRDGSPFMNLLMVAPLQDSKGKIRYFIGAQVDVSGLVKDCVDLESLQSLIQSPDGRDRTEIDDFQELAEMLNMSELETVRKHGGRMHREYQDDDADKLQSKTPHMPRLLLQEPQQGSHHGAKSSQGGKLSGIYRNYLLIRPFPSFRILFASPTLRVPGILQSPFMDKIGGSHRVREELSAALAEGRGVTAKIRWLSRFDEDGRNRWIHCTPLIGSNGQLGVWMVVLVDEDDEINRRWRQAPPVAGSHGGKLHHGGGSKATSNGGSVATSTLERTSLSEHQPETTRGNRSLSPNSVRL